jgi:polar amino acid transport system permease protein
MTDSDLTPYGKFSRNLKKVSRADLLAFIFFAGAVIWLWGHGPENLGYNWQWYRIPRYLLGYQNGVLTAGPLLKGLWVTLEITGFGLFFSALLGVGTALLRLSGSSLGGWVARAYLELIRNTPLLVQILFIYFVLAPVLGIGRFLSGVLALGLFEGAYASEIFRAGITAVERGQWEAAYSLGLTRYQTYRHVVLPQALARVLPPLSGQAISLVKDSALLSAIAVYDLTMEGETIIAETYLTFEVWFMVAAIYLLLTGGLSFLGYLLERRLRRR